MKIFLATLTIIAVTIFWIISSQDDGVQNSINIQQFGQEVDTLVLSWQLDGWTWADGSFAEIQWLGDLLPDLDTNQLQTLQEAMHDPTKTTQFFWVMEALYSSTDNPQVLVVMISKALSEFDHVTAYEHYRTLYTHEDIDQDIDHEQFLFVMVNAVPINASTRQSMQETIDLFLESDWIDKITHTFYSMLIRLADSASDISRVVKDMSQVSRWSGTEYQYMMDELGTFISEAERYQDAPRYYVDALIAHVLLKYQYVWLAQWIWHEVEQLDRDYLLGQQILGYSYFVQWGHDEAINYFEHLLDVDYDNALMYQFFLWVSNFWKGDHDQSAIYFNQVTDGPYALDALRYLIRSYIELEDDRYLIRSYEDLFASWGAKDSDYYTFFDHVFYKPWSEWKRYSLFTRSSDLVSTVMDRCYTDLPDETKFICTYGKAWYLQAIWQWEQAFRNLLLLSTYYPRPYIFERIGDIYTNQGNTSQSKKFYLQAILASDRDDEKLKIKKKLLDVVLE